MEEIAPGITVDQAVRFGKPVLQGTRVPVELVVGKLAGGMSVEEVAEQYELSREAVLGAGIASVPPPARCPLLASSGKGAAGAGQPLARSSSLRTRRSVPRLLADGEKGGFLLRYGVLVDSLGGAFTTGADLGAGPE